MTREEAIVKANEFLIQHRQEVAPEPIAVRRMIADKFNRLLGREVYISDFWVVEFLKILSGEVLAETPGSILIEVSKTKGGIRIREAYPGMWLDESNEHST